MRPWLLAVPTRSARIAPYLRAGCSRRYRRAARLLAGVRLFLFTIGPWANRCISLFRSSGSRDVTEHEACGFGGFQRLETGGLQDNCGPGTEL
ncbi:hypothetical protein NDU88_006821 [Pleurodeles waltl]|uniref:Uncharacterized protein n=1 Tax=Pleurodeles waltl TaxID=8319 RepID=A0AAV7RMN2_PLEWA|nr:hypothetical protein NDU88_006821 [Pleurodeles waltl]